MGAPDPAFRPQFDAGSVVWRFATFELDSRTGELRKSGLRLRLPKQPASILVALLERPGELLTREELQRRIWPQQEIAGDFEQGLNRAVSKLREVLSDQADQSRFIETLPGKGYRFIGALQGQAPVPEHRPKRTPLKILVAATACLAFAIGAVGIRATSPLPRLRWRKLTNDTYLKVPPILSDGTRTYFWASFGGQEFIAQVPLSGGHPTKVPILPPGPVFSLQDLSPDGDNLLVTAAATSSRSHLMPLWAIHIANGTARRLAGIAATSAAYDPVDNKIAFSTPTELWIAGRDGSQPRRLAEMNDSVIGSVYWSPDGK